MTKHYFQLKMSEMCTNGWLPSVSVGVTPCEDCCLKCSSDYLPLPFEMAFPMLFKGGPPAYYSGHDFGCAGQICQQVSEECLAEPVWSQKVRVIRSSGSRIMQFGFNFGSISTSYVTLSKLGLNSPISIKGMVLTS